MPIYEYQCEVCEHKLEKLQKFSDERLKVCPACNGSSLTKLVSAAAFRLKGGGWYETDFKTGGGRNVSGADKSSSDADRDSGSADSASSDVSSGGDASPGNSSTPAAAGQAENSNSQS